MNDKIIELYNAFQIADLDDDMVGMYVAFTDLMREIRTSIPPNYVTPAQDPDDFYKMDPHQPAMELRKNYRKTLFFMTKHQRESDIYIKQANLYVAILFGIYLYHMPVHKMVEHSTPGTESVTRELATDTLLKDNMSPNWLKEPSGKDFTAIML